MVGRIKILLGIFLVITGLILVAAPVGARAQSSPPYVLPESDPIPPSSFKEDGSPGDGQLWKEDPVRVEEAVAGLTAPGQYMAALRDLGLLDHLQQRSSLPGEKATNQWSRVGPVGGFGTWPRNGRIAGYQTIVDGSSYWTYVGSCQGGLWRVHSTSLFQWEDLGTNLPNPSVRGFAVDPDNVDHIFVGTGDHRRYSGAGMFETTNAGVTWNTVTLPFGTSVPKYFYRLLPLGDDPTTSQPRLAGVCDLGPIYSDDGGATWQRGKSQFGVSWGGAWTDLVQHPTSPGSLFAVACDATVGGDSGFYVSPDYGETWTRLGSGVLPPSEDWSRASMAIAPSSPSTIAVLVTKGNVLRGVYKTINTGTGWTDITNELINSGTSYSFGGSQIWHAQAITFKPNDPNTIFVGAVELASSSDGGASWDIGVAGNGIEPGHADITQLFFNPLVGPNYLWICNDGGIYYHNLSTANTYSAIGNSTTGLACSEVDYLDAKGSVVGIGLQDNGNLLSVDGGSTWDFLASGDGADLEIFDHTTGDIFYNNGVYSAAPSWRTYRLFFGGSAVFTSNPAKYMPRLFYSSIQDKMWTSDGTAFYSTDADGTLNWVQEYSNWAPGTHSLRNFWSSYGRESAFWVNYWADNNNGNQNDEDLTYVYKGTSGWTQKHHTNFNPSNDTVLTVRPSNQWPDEAWVGVESPAGSAKIFHLLNGGDTVIDITSNLNMVAGVRAIEVMPFNPLVIWAGTDLGVFQTTDGGATWAPFMEGLPIGRSMELIFVEDVTHSGTHKLMLAIDGRGVWSRDVSMPPIVFVDSRVAVSGTGSRWDPYKTIAAGVAAAPAGAIIAIHADDYNEPMTLSGDKILVTWGGGTVIK